MDDLNKVIAKAKAEADRSAYCKDCNITISTKPRKKDVRWPRGKDGNPVEVVRCPGCGEEASPDFCPDIPPKFEPKDLVVAAAIIAAHLGYNADEAAERAVKLLCALDKLTPDSFEWY